MKVKTEDLSGIFIGYNIDKENLYKVLLEEFDIPGMEIRIANTAFNFLIIKYAEKKELNKTSRGAIKECILMFGIFYTNVAPKACSTSNFEIPANRS